MQQDLFGRRPLFDGGLLDRFLSERRIEAVTNLDDRVEALEKWVGYLKSGRLRREMKETSVEQTFNNLLFNEVLGYTIHPSTSAATAWPKPPTKVTGIRREPDLILGSGLETEQNRRIQAVVELKSPGTDLDMPQPRKGNDTPVEQAFGYGLDIYGVDWIIVTNMAEVRLYSIDWQDSYEQFDLRKCIREGETTQEFNRLFFLLRYEHLIGAPGQAGTRRLLARSQERQLKIRDSFYALYYKIRAVLLDEIREATRSFEPVPERSDVLEATQRLLDRIIFLCFCEDAPEPLIPPETIKRVTEAARLVPNTTVYDALKQLFREVDEGSPPASKIELYGYNGELFKYHYIIDEIDLPDGLHDRTFKVEGPEGTIRIDGVWGVHKFDFWRELTEHLLGHIFEESLSDAVELRRDELTPLSEKLAERKKHGIYYTSRLISDFLVDATVGDLIDEVHAAESDPNGERSREWYEDRISELSDLTIVDFACGSGAFMVSAFDVLLTEYHRLKNSMHKQENEELPALLAKMEKNEQSKLLRGALYGVDLLPQAVEIAKLSLWLKSAHKGEKVANLQENIVVSNSLRISKTLDLLDLEFGEADAVVGNPPWGSDMRPEVRDNAIETLGLDDGEGWDSWELFLALALRSLREGGRLGLVLPDTIFSPEKERIRQILLEESRVEKLHNVGPDWFGSDVRMGAVVLQARKGSSSEDSTFPGMVLSGELRREAIRGETPIRQLESQLARRIPQRRCEEAEDYAIELFRGEADDVVMRRMESESLELGEFCNRGRGEEMSKAGYLWRCPSCLGVTTPGRTAKGGGYKPTECEHCGYEIEEDQALEEYVVVDECPEDDDCVPFIDGDDISRRYATSETGKLMRLIDGWDYKEESLYSSPKVLIRQAGVGLMATLDRSGAYFPQSVYVYRIKDEYQEEGYSHEYLLGALLSRTMTYYIFKRYGEVDPARAHAKMTHTRLSVLPIPTIDFSSDDEVAIHGRIVDSVQKLLKGDARLGGPEDQAIESGLRKLWGLNPEVGAYINGEFSDLPKGQAVEDLFPMGVPDRAVEVSGDMFEKIDDDTSTVESIR